jgi:glycosyltransferase involved in cell wall biosynthesis
MKTITILHVIDTLQTGGTESQLLRLLPHLDRQQFRHVLCPLQLKGHLTTALGEGVKLHPLGLSKNNLPGGVAALREMIRRDEPALLHTHLFAATLMGRVAGRLTGKPVLTTLVNTPYAPAWRVDDPALSRWKVEAVRALDALTAPWTTWYVAISEAVKRAAVQDLRLPPDRITVIPRGVELGGASAPSAGDVAAVRRSLGWVDADPLILNVGRLVPQKGQRYLIEAMAAVVRRLPRARLAIAGEGRIRPSLEAQIRTLGLAAVVQLLGDRRDVPLLLAAADIFVFPSLSEGFGVALLEAMAAARPCVVSDLEVVREVAGPEAAVLVPPADAGGLAEALLAVAGDQERRRTLAAAALARAQRFSLAAAARRLEDVYRHIASGAEAVRPLVGAGTAL